MDRFAEVLLGDLELRHHFGVLHRVEQGMNRFAWLEVYRSILYLQDDIITELAVKRHEFIVSLTSTVGTIGCIDKGTPHNDSSIRLQGICQHIGSIDMSTSEVLWSGFSLTVCFHQKTAKIGDGIVDFLYFILPPFNDIRIERISCRNIAQCFWRSKIYR